MKVTDVRTLYERFHLFSVISRISPIHFNVIENYFPRGSFFPPRPEIFGGKCSSPRQTDHQRQARFSARLGSPRPDSVHFSQLADRALPRRWRTRCTIHYGVQPRRKRPSATRESPSGLSPRRAFPRFDSASNAAATGNNSPRGYHCTAGT